VLIITSYYVAKTHQAINITTNTPIKKVTSHEVIKHGKNSCNQITFKVSSKQRQKHINLLDSSINQ